MEKWLSLLSQPFKLLKVCSHLVVVYLIFQSISVVKDMSASGFTGDFELVGRDEKGNIKVGVIKASKTLPERTPLNMFSYQQSLLNGSRTISYGRHVMRLGDFNFYGLGGISLHDSDKTEFTVGLALTF